MRLQSSHIPQFLCCELQSLLEPAQREVCRGQEGDDYYGTLRESADYDLTSAGFLQPKHCLCQSLLDLIGLGNLGGGGRGKGHAVYTGLGTENGNETAIDRVVSFPDPPRTPRRTGSTVGSNTGLGTEIERRLSVCACVHVCVCHSTCAITELVGD